MQNTLLDRRTEEVCEYIKRNITRDISLIGNDGFDHIIFDSHKYIMNVCVYVDKYEVYTVNKEKLRRAKANARYGYEEDVPASNEREFKKPSSLVAYLRRYSYA